MDLSISRLRFLIPTLLAGSLIAYFGMQILNGGSEDTLWHAEGGGLP